MVDVISSTVLLALNIGFICLGGYAMSLLESKSLENEIERYMNISGQVIRAAGAKGEGNEPIVNMTHFIGNASVACSNSKSVPWTYGQSFYFSLSIITTVGWGVLSPSTYVGKAVTCLYAFLGIPIYAMAIGLIKDRCGRVFRRLVRVSEDVSWYWMPLCLVILVTIFMNIAINLGAEYLHKELKEMVNLTCTIIAPYKHWQANASIWDGIYFQFISVSTIGFGDTYLRLFECEGSSADSVVSAISGFILFSVLLGMCAHLFDVLSDQSQSGLSSLSSKITKRVAGGNSDQRTYGQI